MDNQWYYSRDGQPIGPFSESQLQQMAAGGQLRPTDHVWKSGMKDWVEARTIPGLFPIVAKPVPPTLAERATVFVCMSGLALRHVCEVIAGNVVSDTLGGAINALTKCFADQSQRLPRALERANERAWKTLEFALAEESFWSRVKGKLSRAEDQTLVQKVRELLSLAAPKGTSNFRVACLQELRHARTAGKLQQGTADPAQLAQQTVDFARFGDPKELLDAEWRLVEKMAEQLRPDYPNLATLLSHRPQQDSPLLVLTVRYYFRREVEENRELFQGITFAHLENLSKSQQESFAWLAEQSEHLESLLEEVRETVKQTHGSVLRIEEELQKQSPQVQKMYEVLLDLQKKLDLQGVELKSGASFSIRNDAERQEVKAFLERYRSMPAAERRARPALVNAVAKLKVAAGDFDSAEKDFQEVVTLVAADQTAQSEVHYNRYLSHLESKHWEYAMAALQEAAQLAPERYAPFPLQKYQPKRILGAGGFGVAFLCENMHTGAEVVIKTLRGEGAGMDVRQVFREARLLAGLRHPAIIHVYDCDYADAARQRAYLVMEYFEGQTLDQFIKQPGPIAPANFLPVALQIAEGMQAAHDRGVLHRDIKPSNMLVGKVGGQWQVKLIDFGLAVAQSVAAHANTLRSKSTQSSSDIAGTREYAAPEQLGRLEGVKLGPYSDIYGFGKTCCYALFKTTQPLPKHFRGLPDELTYLLEDCLDEDPRRRPQSFAQVVERLRKAESALSRTVTPAQSAVTAGWYYLTRSGKQKGPVDSEQMAALIVEGQVDAETLVWQKGMHQWIAAGMVAEFFPEVKKSAPLEEDTVLPVVPASSANASQVTGEIHLDGLGGNSAWGGELEVLLDDKPIGTGTSHAGFHLNYQTSVGHHTLKVCGRNTGVFSLAGGAVQVFPVHFPKAGKYRIDLDYSGVMGVLRKVNPTGGTPPTNIRITRMKGK